MAICACTLLECCKENYCFIDCDSEKFCLLRKEK